MRTVWGFHIFQHNPSFSPLGPLSKRGAQGAEKGSISSCIPTYLAVELKQQLAQAPFTLHHRPLSSFLLPAPILHVLYVSFPGPFCFSISETKGSGDRQGFEKKCLHEEQLERGRGTGEKPPDDRSRLLVWGREAGEGRGGVRPAEREGAKMGEGGPPRKEFANPRLW